MQNNPELLNCSNNIISGITKPEITESIFNKTCNEISNRLIGNTIIPQNEIQNFTAMANIPIQPFTTIPNTFTTVSVPLQPVQINQPVQSAGTNNPIDTINIEITKSNYYSLLGYEFSLWTWILILVILLTIIYFIYKFFFSEKENIVNMKKSKNITKSINSKPGEKLNQEISDSESSDSESEDTNNTS